MSITRFATRSNTTRKSTATIDRTGIVPFKKPKISVATTTTTATKVANQPKATITVNAVVTTEQALTETAEELVSTEASDTGAQNRKARRKVR
jgi:RNA:NAD 2'-phosphotransferase (TPT1/KptA family)